MNTKLPAGIYWLHDNLQSRTGYLGMDGGIRWYWAGGGKGGGGVDIHFLEGSWALGFVFTSWNIISSRLSNFSALTSKKLLALISYTRFSWKECRGKFQIRLNMKDGPLYKNKLKLKDVNIYAKHHTWRRSKLIAFL